MTRRGWSLFGTVAVLWGLPYLFIRVAVQADVDPVVVVWLRTGGAALVLLPLALHRRALRGLAARWRGVVALTLVQITAPFLLITYGEQQIPSSLAGLLVAAEPMFVVLLIAGLGYARRRGSRHQDAGDQDAGDPDAGDQDAGDPVRGGQVVGLVVGLGGVVALLGLDVRGPGTSLVGAGLVLMAALLYAAGALLIRRVSTGTDPTGVITAILAVNTVLLAPVASPRLPERLPPVPVTASLAVLAVLCTAAAFMSYFALIAEVGPARATVVFYVTPVVTVAAGVLVLAEPLTAGTVPGLLLIVAGSWLATRVRAPRHRGDVAR